MKNQIKYCLDMCSVCVYMKHTFYSFNSIMEACQFRCSWQLLKLIQLCVISELMIMRTVSLFWFVSHNFLDISLLTETSNPRKHILLAVSLQSASLLNTGTGWPLIWVEKDNIYSPWISLYLLIYPSPLCLLWWILKTSNSPLPVMVQRRN